MKNIYHYILIFLSFSILSGCEDNLEPNLYGTITTENFFQTEQDLNAATTAIYHELRLGGWAPYLFSDGSSFLMDMVATEVWTTRWGWTSFLNGSWNVGDQMTDGFYRWTATAVTRCTYTIAKIEESPVDDAIKEQYIAQIRALRAFFVYDIYRLYGPMPLIVDKEIALNPDPDYKPSRPTKEEVQNFLKTELRMAADVLPARQDEYGKVTKGAALHYLLKNLMHEKDYPNALEIANEIIGLGVYSLEPIYADVFSAQNENNNEVMFVVVGEPEEKYGNHTYVNIIPGDFKSPHGNSLSGWNGHRMEWDFYDTFDQNDLRRELILAKYESNSGDIVDLRANGDLGALPLKYGIDPEATGIWAGNDKVLDRFAEVILFKAEILSELNGPNQESVDLINEIRTRAFEGAVEVPDEIILEENFDADFVDNVIGAISVNNYQADVASISFDKDESDVLGDGNSLHIGLENSGTEWWAIQVRTGDIAVENGRTYTVSFKIKATKDVTFDFKSEGPLSASVPISLVADQPTELTLDLGAAGSDGNAVMFFALGNTANDYDIWIDSFVITKKASSGGEGGDYLLKLADVSSPEAMQDAILAERGWEFWYEGKRREDLIRMGKYVEVGQQNANNFSDRNLLFPIPNYVIIENPNIVQNTGW